MTVLAGSNEYPPAFSEVNIAKTNAAAQLQADHSSATGHAEPTAERMRRNREAIRVLRSFMEEDDEEQRETLEYLKEAIPGLESETMQTKRRPQQQTSDRPMIDGNQPDHEQTQRNLRLIQVLDSFLEEDAEEQRETWEYLKRVLDEDRPEGQKLFQ